MTLKIEITLPDEKVHRDFLAEHMSTLGFYDNSLRTGLVSGGVIGNTRDIYADANCATRNLSGAPTQSDIPSVLNETSVQQAVTKRERGKPAPGRARRTKEEIAEDEAADVADAREQDAPQIRTNPEDRHEVQDDPATQAQDKADEQAEVKANRNPEKPLTKDDLRNAMGEYVNIHGMPATQEIGPKIFREALGEPPAGEAIWKLSLVPDDQDSLRKAIATWNAAVAKSSDAGVMA